MDLCEFNANLVYRVRSGSLRGVQIAQNLLLSSVISFFLSLTHFTSPSHGRGCGPSLSHRAYRRTAVSLRVVQTQ